MATLTPEFTTPWTNIILCWKPVSFPRLTKFQPCNSVLHVCSAFSRGKESSLHPLRAIYSSRCSLAKARPTESAPLTENRTPCLSGSRQDVFSCFVYKFKNWVLLSRVSHPLFPVFYNPWQHWGKLVHAFQGKGIFLLLLVLYFCFNTVYQSVQPGQVSMVRRPSEKLGRTQVVTSPLRIPLQKNSLKSEFCEGCSRGASSHLLLVLQGTKLSSLFQKW